MYKREDKGEMKLMKWNNVTPKQGIDLIKQKSNKDDMYNISMNKVKTPTNDQPPKWAKELIQTVSRIEAKVDNNTEMIKNNTRMIEKNHSMIKTAHPELF